MCTHSAACKLSVRLAVSTDRTEKVLLMCEDVWMFPHTPDHTYVRTPSGITVYKQLN